MNTPQPPDVGLDPALESLMSQMDDALFEGRSTDEFEREISERFGDSPSQIVATLKALHSARAEHLSVVSSGEPSLAGQTLGTASAVTWSSAGLPKTMFGRFEIEKRIGSGGAGTVFRARDSKLGRLIALKVARAEALFSGEAQQRFVREAQTLAALRHPNIIPIYEFGESDGLPFIVEELCEGPNLAVWLKENVDTRRKVPIRMAARWLRDLSRAVAHAHRCGIVHRDLKPSNVLLSPQPAEAASAPREGDDETLVPRVTDFGIAKLFGSEEAVTASLAVLGTAAYMAPEQAEGRSREVGPPADVYSLGVILYEVVTGQRPIEGRSDVDTLRRVLTDEPVPLSQVRRDAPRDLEAICLKCLDKNAADRYPSAAELADDLDRFLDAEPVVARRLRPVGRLMRSWRRRQTTSSAFAMRLFFALWVLAGVLIIWRSRHGDLIIWQSGSSSEQPKVVSARQTYPYDVHQASILLSRTDVDLAARMAMAHEARPILAKYIPQSGGEDLRGIEWHYLWRIAHPQSYAPMFVPVRTIAAHRNAAYAVCFSADSKSVATASADRTAKVWDIASGELRFALVGHKDEINGVAFSADGKLLATASDDATVRLWDGTTGAIRNTLWKHTGPVVGVAFNPVNGLLACVTRDGVLTTWDPASSRQIETLKVHSGKRVDDIAFSPDGQFLATAGGDCMAWLWQVSKPLHQLGYFSVSGRALSVGFSHDSQRLAVGHANGARVFPISNREVLAQLHLDDHSQTHFVRAARFTRDDSSLLTAGDRFASRLVDLTTGENWDPIDSAGDLWSAALSPDGRWAATVDGSGQLVLWDCSARMDLHQTPIDIPLRTPGVHIALSPTGKHIAVAADAAPDADAAKAGSAELDVWDISSRQPSRVLQVKPTEPSFHFDDMAFSSDGDVIAYAGRRSAQDHVQIRVVNATNGAARFEVDSGAAELDRLVFSPGGSTLIAQEQAGKAGGRLQVRDARSGALTRTIPLKSNSPLSACYPSEALFAFAQTDNASRIDFLRVSDSQGISTVNGFGETVHSLAFTSDGRRLVGRGNGGYVELLARETGNVVRQFTVSGVSSVAGFALAVSPDGRLLALAAKDGIVLADIQSSQALCTLRFPGEMERVSQVLFASDGLTVAANALTPSGQCAVYLWQVSTAAAGPPQSGQGL